MFWLNQRIEEKEEHILTSLEFKEKKQVLCTLVSVPKLNKVKIALASSMVTQIIPGFLSNGDQLTAYLASDVFALDPVVTRALCNGQGPHLSTRLVSALVILPTVTPSPLMEAACHHLA